MGVVAPVTAIIEEAVVCDFGDPGEAFRGFDGVGGVGVGDGQGDVGRAVGTTADAYVCELVVPEGFLGRGTGVCSTALRLCREGKEEEGEEEEGCFHDDVVFNYSLPRLWRVLPL